MVGRDNSRAVDTGNDEVLAIARAVVYDVPGDAVVLLYATGAVEGVDGVIGPESGNVGSREGVVDSDLERRGCGFAVEAALLDPAVCVFLSGCSRRPDRVVSVDGWGSGARELPRVRHFFAGVSFAQELAEAVSFFPLVRVLPGSEGGHLSPKLLVGSGLNAL